MKLKNPIDKIHEANSLTTTVMSVAIDTSKEVVMATVKLPWTVFKSIIGKNEK